jgi:hypothetical protein
MQRHAAHDGTLNSAHHLHRGLHLHRGVVNDRSRHDRSLHHGHWDGSVHLLNTVLVLGDDLAGLRHAAEEVPEDEGEKGSAGDGKSDGEAGLEIGQPVGIAAVGELRAPAIVHHDTNLASVKGEPREHAGKDPAPHPIPQALGSIAYSQAQKRKRAKGKPAV